MASDEGWAGFAKAALDHRAEVIANSSNEGLKAPEGFLDPEPETKKKKEKKEKKVKKREKQEVLS